MGLELAVGVAGAALEQAALAEPGSGDGAGEAAGTAKFGEEAVQRLRIHAARHGQDGAGQTLFVKRILFGVPGRDQAATPGSSPDSSLMALASVTPSRRAAL